MIHSRAPTRISFAGGGTDIPEIASKIGGCVTSIAIDVYNYASIKERGDKNIFIRSVRADGSEESVSFNAEKIRYDGRLDLAKSVIEALNKDRSGFDVFLTTEAPKHSGLGSSSSMYAALIASFNEFYNLKMSRKDIAELAFHLEREKLGNKVGRQDQYAAVFGGLNFIEFFRNGARLRPIKTAQKTIFELQKNIALLYLRERKLTAGQAIKKQLGNIKAFEKTKELGVLVKESLEKNDLKSFGKIMPEVWTYKKKFSGSNKFIDLVYNTAVSSGAVGGKVAGAGGGGCAFFLCHPLAKQKVIASLERIGARNINFSFDFSGVVVWKE